MSSDIYFKKLFSNHQQPPRYNVINQYVYKCVLVFIRAIKFPNQVYRKYLILWCCFFYFKLILNFNFLLVYDID